MRIAGLICVLLPLLPTCGCSERPTHVTLAGGSTPVFRLSGSGEFGTFLVYLVPPSPETMGRSIEEQTPAWSLVAQPDWLHGRAIEEIGELTYGVTPEGYAQPNAPQPLIPGRVYFFECETTDAPTAQGFFKIEDGKTIPAHANLPCMMTRNGTPVYVPCSSSKP